MKWELKYSGEWEVEVWREQVSAGHRREEERLVMETKTLGGVEDPAELKTKMF